MCAISVAHRGPITADMLVIPSEGQTPDMIIIDKSMIIDWRRKGLDKAEVSQTGFLAIVKAYATFH